MAVAKKASRFDRQVEQSPRSGDQRTEVQRDYDRILYSSALRRLSGVTQVVSPSEGQLIHNRLTHTLEVAQVARGVAEYLIDRPGGGALADAAGGLEVPVVEAAALAHDLGHPPFGHIAEYALNRAMSTQGIDPRNGFEGNAQSFRIVTRRSVRYSDVRGLNLTRATLSAILKYPWTRSVDSEQPSKWGVYTSEETEFQWAREWLPTSFTKRTLEAAIMDWADDVAYAVHDLEDFARAGLVPLDRLYSDRNERRRFLESELVRLRIPDRTRRRHLTQVFKEIIKSSLIDSPYRGTHANRAELRSFTSQLINRYVTATDLIPSKFGEEALHIKPFALDEVRMLKGLTWFYVINSQSMASQRVGQEKIVSSLFNELYDSATSSQSSRRHIFPVYQQESLQDCRTNAEKARIVADYIAGMSEAEAIATYSRLTGSELGSSFSRFY